MKNVLKTITKALIATACVMGYVVAWLTGHDEPIVWGIIAICIGYIIAIYVKAKADDYAIRKRDRLNAAHRLERIQRQSRRR